MLWVLFIAFYMLSVPTWQLVRLVTCPPSEPASYESDGHQSCLSISLISAGLSKEQGVPSYSFFLAQLFVFSEVNHFLFLLHFF